MALRTIKIQCGDYGKEDAGRLDYDEDGYFVPISVHATYKKKTTSKYWGRALVHGVWQYISLGDKNT